MAENFTSLPIIDFRDALCPETKPRFLSALRHALVKVGFLYLKNPPIQAEVQKELVRTTGSFFHLPTRTKQEMKMANSKHFRGYTGLGIEKTATKADERETYWVGFESPATDPDQPIWYNLLGPNQWPTKADAPGFRESIETYLEEVQHLATDFTALVAEALDLEPMAFNKLFQDPPTSGLKIAAYPAPPNALQDSQIEFQGVGPHKDGSFLTYLLQGTEHTGSLEVQNNSGVWIPAPSVPNTLIINIGRSLEALTQGVCVATTHRVNLTPQQYITSENAPIGTRLTFPFFQMLSLDVKKEDLSLQMPPHIACLRDKDVKSDAETFFASLFNRSLGEALMTNALTSHPEVGKNWYPDLLKEALKQQEEAKRQDDARLNGNGSGH